MPEGTPETRVAIAQQFLVVVGHRDIDQGIEFLAPHATYRVPGTHALAGTFSGRDEIMRHLITLFERTGGTLDVFKWEDWMVGESHVAALAKVHINTKGQMYSARHLFLVRFDIHDKIEEVTVFFEDQRAAERFIGA
jgi:ketosteroid isomerase-like protein